MSVFMDLNVSYTADTKQLQNLIETAAHRESNVTSTALPAAERELAQLAQLAPPLTSLGCSVFR